MNFVFFGTPYPARDTLEVLKAHGLIPKLIVTNPDTPQGRGHVLTPTLTNVWARENDVPVLTPHTLDDETIAHIAAVGAEVGICVAYGKILPDKLINVFPKGILNVHYSLLPQYRGASPVEGVLLDGNRETGVTIQRMVPRLDAGDIVVQEVVAIVPGETAKELRPRLVHIGAELLIASLSKYMSGEIVPKPQNEASATYVGKIAKEAGRIDLDAPGHENWNKYRAYAEWPGTYFFTERNGKPLRIKITKAELTPDGAFNILRVVPEGKRETDYETFAKNFAS